MEQKEQEHQKEQKKEQRSITDSASLTFFTNPAYHAILQRKHALTASKNNAEEIKFYRKRIVALFKELLKTPEAVEAAEVKEMHSLFVNAAVRYFEMTDKKDIIQGQHSQGQASAAQETAAQGQEETDLSMDDLLEGPETLAEANQLMTRKTIVVANLDNFVTSKDTSANDIVRIIPLKLELDLKTTDLKTKGLVPKTKELVPKTKGLVPKKNKEKEKI